MGPGRGVSKSMQALQALSGTLNKFAVTNRHNMFVLEDKAKEGTGMNFYRSIQRLFD